MPVLGENTTTISVYISLQIKERLEHHAKAKGVSLSRLSADVLSKFLLEN